MWGRACGPTGEKNGYEPRHVSYDDSRPLSKHHAGGNEVSECSTEPDYARWRTSREPQESSELDGGMRDMDA